MGNCKVSVDEVFGFTINGVLLKGFKKESSWEGLHKLRNEDGQFIIVDFDPSNNARVTVLRMSGELNKMTPEITAVSPSFDVAKYRGAFQPTHTHIKNGNDYQLLHISNRRATKPGWEQMAVYTDGDVVWTRPAKDFNERFSTKSC